MRVALYMRQSDTGGAGEASLSLDSQERALRDRCAKEGWAVVAAHKDADLRGWQEEGERPGLDACIGLAERGEIDLILVWDLSRFARNLRLQESWIWQFNRRGVEVESHTEPHVRADPFMRQILGAVNEKRTREISTQIKRSMRERGERGLSGHRPPYGFRRTDKDRPIEPDPDDPLALATVRRIYSGLIAGATYSELAAAFSAEGVPTPSGTAVWFRQTVKDIATNPAYRGASRMAGVVVEGAHPAIVEPADWHAAQRPVEAGRFHRRKSERHWAEGLVLHACGRRMHLHSSHVSRHNGLVPARFVCAIGNVNRADPNRPVCPHSPRQMAAGRLGALAWEALRRDLSRVLDPREVIAGARRAWRDQAPQAGRALRDLAARERRLGERRRRADEAYLAGLRDIAWLRAEQAKIDAEMAAVAAGRAGLPSPPDPAALAAAFALLADVGAALDAIDDDGRAAVLRRLGHAVVVPAGVPYGRGDAGRVVIRYGPEFAPFVAPEPG